MQDVAYGLRQLRKSPAFVAVAVLSVALGIGANTAIFSLINAFMLQMLPVKDPGRHVLFYDGIGIGTWQGVTIPVNVEYASDECAFYASDTFSVQPDDAA